MRFGGVYDSGMRALEPTPIAGAFPGSRWSGFRRCSGFVGRLDKNFDRYAFQSSDLDQVGKGLGGG